MSVGPKKKRPRGQPPLPNGMAKDCTFAFWVRMTPAEVELVNGAIKRSKLTKSAWGRMAFLKAANRPALKRRARIETIETIETKGT